MAIEEERKASCTPDGGLGQRSEGREGGEGLEIAPTLCLWSRFWHRLEDRGLEMHQEAPRTPSDLCEAPARNSTLSCVKPWSSDFSRGSERADIPRPDSLIDLFPSFVTQIHLKH